MSSITTNNEDCGMSSITTKVEEKKYECPCGSLIKNTTTCINRHKKTDKHNNYLEDQERRIKQNEHNIIINRVNTEINNKILKDRGDRKTIYTEISDILPTVLQRIVFEYGESFVARMNDTIKKIPRGIELHNIQCTVYIDKKHWFFKQLDMRDKCCYTRHGYILDIIDINTTGKYKGSPYIQFGYKTQYNCNIKQYTSYSNKNFLKNLLNRDYKGVYYSTLTTLSKVL